MEEFVIDDKFLVEGEYIGNVERTKKMIERKVNFPPVLYA